MRSSQRPLQLFDPFLLLGIGLRGCASPPKRSLGSRFHFILPAVIKVGSDLVLAARLCHVAALQTFQHNLPFLFWGSLHSRLSRHSRLLAEAPSLTNFRVQFYRGALHSLTIYDFFFAPLFGRPSGLKLYSLHKYCEIRKVLSIVFLVQKSCRPAASTSCNRPSSFKNFNCGLTLGCFIPKCCAISITPRVPFAAR